MTAPDFDDLETINLRLHNLRWLIEAWAEEKGNSPDANALYCLANNVQRAHEDLSDWLRAAHVETKGSGPVAVP